MSSGSPRWWFQEPPSAEWQWVVLVLGIIGFVVAMTALPTVFQMLGGRPKIELDFAADPAGLRCAIGQPLVAGWLRPLGVRRTPVEINAFLSIQNVETGRDVVSGSMSDLIHIGGDPPRKWMTLGPSILSPLILIVATRTADGAVAGDDTRTPLEPGTYEADVTVMHGGTDFTKTKRRFVVRVDGLDWIGS